MSTKIHGKLERGPEVIVGLCSICGGHAFEDGTEQHTGYCGSIQDLQKANAALEARIVKLEARLNAAPNGVRFS